MSVVEEEIEKTDVAEGSSRETEWVEACSRVKERGKTTERGLSDKSPLFYRELSTSHCLSQNFFFSLDTRLIVFRLSHHH